MIKKILIAGLSITTSFIIAIAFFVLGLKVANNYLETPNTNPDKLFAMVQEWREDQNLPPLKENEMFCKFAAYRAGMMRTDFSHTGFTEDSPQKQELFNAGFHYLGENLAMLNNISFDPENQILTGWLNSPKHKEAIEANYTDSCIRCEGRFCVQIFGSSKDPQ